MKIDPKDVELTAYALGELDAAERAEVEKRLEKSPPMRRRVHELQQLAGTLTSELKQETCPGLTEENRMAIDSELNRPLRRGGFPWGIAGVAACLLVAAGIYLMAINGSDENTVAQSNPEPASSEPQEQPDTDVIPVAEAPSVESTELVPEKQPENDPIPEVVATTTVNWTAFDPDTIEPNPPTVDRIDSIDWLNQPVRNTWQENQIEPSELASDGEFIRRAYLDIVGHIPPIEKTREYISSRDKDKKSRLIMELVNSDEFAQYWSTIWANQLIGRTPGRNIDRRSLEKFLRDGFAANKPWNSMVYDLVSATGGSTPRSLERGVPFNGATNFLLAHMNDGRVPATSFTTRLFLGVQVQCTQCHDHPFNDRTQEAFWGINAFFQRMDRQDHNDVDDTGRRQFLFAELSEPELDSEGTLFVRYDKRDGMVGVTLPRLLDGSKVTESNRTLRDELARYIVHPENKFFAKSLANRVWAHFLGQGIVHPMDDLGEHNEPSNPELLDKLATNFRETNYNLKRLITWVAMSEAYSLSSETNDSNAEDDLYFSHFPLKQMSPEQMFDSLMVATKADRAGAGSWEAADQMRQGLLRQFTVAFGNDENTEADTFNGTIPQALLMMNGNLMSKAVSTQKGSFVRERVEQATKKGRGADIALLNDLYLAALSRYPSSQEKSWAGMVVRGTNNPVDGYQDVFWALLNSGEFVLNH